MITHQPPLMFHPAVPRCAVTLNHCILSIKYCNAVLIWLCNSWFTTMWKWTLYKIAQIMWAEQLLDWENIHIILQNCINNYYILFSIKFFINFILKYSKLITYNMRWHKWTFGQIDNIYIKMYDQCLLYKVYARIGCAIKDNDY